MDRLTDLIRQHPELATILARLDDLVRQNTELEAERAVLRRMIDELQRHVEELRMRLRSLPSFPESWSQPPVSAGEEAAGADEPIVRASGRSL